MLKTMFVASANLIKFVMMEQYIFDDLMKMGRHSKKR